MQSVGPKTKGYQLKKQAVYDAIYKSCETNGQEQVSISSVIQYISNEIGSNLKHSEEIINDLKQKLQDRNEEGWLSFFEVCEILSVWMDCVSCATPNDTSKSISEAVVFGSHEAKSHQPTLLSSQVRNNDINCNSARETIFTNCEKCGREENCCEWRNNETSREEIITRSYDQKVTELQNLLRQSEDCNSIIHQENESLRRNYTLLQNKEQRWLSREEEFIEREQQLSLTSASLREHIVIAEREIQNLKQQISRVKMENDKLVAENHILEERLADSFELEKLLNEARQQLSRVQLDLHSKELAAADLETKLEHLQEYNEVLEAQISEMKNYKSPTTSFERIHEQSLGEEMMIADISDEVSFKNNDLVCVDIGAESSIKAELDACGQWPLQYIHVAVQATTSIATNATQTDGRYVSEIYDEPELIYCEKEENMYFSDEINAVKQFDSSELDVRLSIASGTVANLCRKYLNDYILTHPQLLPLMDSVKKIEFSEQVMRQWLRTIENICGNLSSMHSDKSTQTNSRLTLLEEDIVTKLFSTERVDKMFIPSKIEEISELHLDVPLQTNQIIHPLHDIFEKLGIPMKPSSLSVATETEDAVSQDIAKLHSNVSTQTNQTPSPVSQSGSSLYIPVVHNDVQTQICRQYRSMYEMEVFVMVDALTQTDFRIEDKENEEFDTSHSVIKSDKKQVSKISRKKKFRSFMNVNLSCMGGNVLD